MAHQLSAYEQQRLDNIARNQAVLRELGLLEDKKQPPAAPKKRCNDDDDDDDDDVGTFKMPPEPSRRSDRVSKKPALYKGLTDAYFNTEEKEDDDETTRPCVSTRPQRMLGSPRPSFADEYQRDAPQRRRVVIDERRMTVHIPNLNAAPTATAHDIPNAALMQPPERGRQFSAMEHLGAIGQLSASKFGVETMGGTSRSSAHPCPFCNKPTLVRAADRATGFVYLKKHWCNGVENDKVRIY